jgi:hypothetical protein
MAGDYSERTIKFREWWAEHGWAIFLYLVLSIGLTWPMVAQFTTRIPGDGYDAYNGLWVMWHTKEAILGNQPFFDLPTLYYPHGATLLTHIPGLATGFFALPFWPLGPEAAHNGQVLVSFILTGYLTYLLGRTLKLDRPTAFFAGLILLVAPMHLLGLRGHTTKVFLGAAPLVLLCVFRTFDLSRSRWGWGKWAIATALALLFAMLHDSSQFLTAGAAVLLVALFVIFTAQRNNRIRLFRRLLVIALASLIIVGPLLAMTALAGFNPDIVLELNQLSFDYQPDLTEFVIPSTQSQLFGSFATDFFERFQIEPLIETAVSISWVALILMGIVVLRGNSVARFWIAFTLFWIILSIGPTIRFLNQTTFTEYNLPIIMPYAFVTGLPGLDFLRTPGRYMQIGFVGVGIAAAYGLAWVRQRWPNYARTLTIGAILLVLLESWPKPWQTIPLRPLPKIYRQIASDEEIYGVFDVPQTYDQSITTAQYNATYQMYQIHHSKGIPMGYLSRTYGKHPVFPCFFQLPSEKGQLLVNGDPAPCPFHPLYDLPLNNYRYVVVHKPQPEFFDYKPGTQGEAEAAEFINTFLSDQTPIIDDHLTTVYQMPASPDISALFTTLGYGENWHGPEAADGDSWRWAASPAELIISSPVTQKVTLEMDFFVVYIPPDAAENYQSRLHIEMDNGFQTIVEIETGQMTAVPLQLSPGKQILTLTLEAGGFQPSNEQGEDNRFLSFAVRYINLVTTNL